MEAFVFLQKFIYDLPFGWQFTSTSKRLFTGKLVLVGPLVKNFGAFGFSGLISGSELSMPS